MTIHSPLVANTVVSTRSPARGDLGRYVFRKNLRDTLYGETALYHDTHLQKLVVLKRISLSLLHQHQQQQQQQEEDDEEERDETAGTVREDPLNERAVMQLLDDPLLACAPGRTSIVAYEREGFFAVQDSVFVAMEFCTGGDLYDYVTAQPTRRLQETDALALVAQVASGLSFLHAMGVAHRDLSLENVLLENGRAKLCDFGVSVTTAHDDCASQRVGKYYYRAPEVGHGAKRYDPKAADVWSLGVLLLILLTGSPLFVDEQARAPTLRVLQKYGVGKLLELWGVRQDVSTSTVKLLALMLQVEPLRRVSADDVAHHPLLQPRACVTVGPTAPCTGIKCSQVGTI
ncbi:unnamed protein product [Hyaloperonospora brassicae]|uniref:Protein kinase domain-containing protein n=1 Tax=Hyaloperonospora brassicae TaxID=162125 RepID=A0AAV0V1L5_HYABA|nr:unnamed protein product [Hyaloperonospora brassicae]